MKTKKSYDYNEVVNWTKRMNVLKIEKLILPINTNNSHWTLACVYVVLSRINFICIYIFFMCSYLHRRYCLYIAYIVCYVIF